MSIREKLKQWKRFAAGATAAVLCAGLLAGCTGKNPAGSSDGTAAQEGPQRYSTIFYDAFDTVTQVIAYCDSEEEFTRQMDALHADLLEYHQLYDIYNDYDGVTNIKTINDNAGTAPVQVDDKILGMLELARQMYNTTDGKLNIAMGSVLRIWHDYREAAGRPRRTRTTSCPARKSWTPPPGTATSTTLSWMKKPKPFIWQTRKCRWMWAAWARATPWKWCARPLRPGA